MIYEFIVMGKPQGKARPRFNRRTGHTYTPSQTRVYETEIKGSFLEKYPRPIKLDTPLVVKIDAYFDIPSSASKNQQIAMAGGLIRPVKKPDADNIIKAICDALNGLAYVDDSQIVCVSCRKLYSNQARCEVTISELVR